MTLGKPVRQGRPYASQINGREPEQLDTVGDVEVTVVRILT